jgi:hypothetical protein
MFESRLTANGATLRGRSFMRSDEGVQWPLTTIKWNGFNIETLKKDLPRSVAPRCKPSRDIQLKHSGLPFIHIGWKRPLTTIKWNGFNIETLKRSLSDETQTSFWSQIQNRGGFSVCSLTQPWLTWSRNFRQSPFGIPISSYGTGKSATAG